MAKPPMGRLLQLDRFSHHRDAGQGGVTPALPAARGPFTRMPAGALPPGYADSNRLRALSWLSHTVAQLVEKRGVGPMAEVDAAIAEGNQILQSLAALHLPRGDSAADCAEATSAIREIQERVARWRERILR